VTTTVTELPEQALLLPMHFTYAPTLNICRDDAK
jgi:hypothetical protein